MTNSGSKKIKVFLDWKNTNFNDFSLEIKDLKKL